MRNKIHVGILGSMLFAVVVMLAQPVFSVPLLMNYQGVLTGVSGEPLTGTVTMTFEIFDHETAGEPTFGLWSETHTGVELEGGVYTVLLGSVNPTKLIPDVFVGDGRWLEITVNGEKMTPRQQLASVPFAHNAETLDGEYSTAFLKISDPSTTLAGKLYLPANGLKVGTNQLVTASGRVGIGTTAPGTALDVNGTVNATSFKGSGDALFNIPASSLTGALALPANGLTVGTNQLVTSNGRVGIGTASPGTALDVNGTVNATTFKGSGASLNNIPAGSLTGTVSTLRYSAISDLVAEGATGVTTTEIGHLEGVTADIQTQLNAKSPKNNPIFTGKVTLPGQGIWENHGGVGIGASNIFVDKMLHVKTTGKFHALVVKTDGRIGMGEDDPQAGLHLRGAGYPESFLFLDSINSFGQDSGIRLRSSVYTRWHIYNDASRSNILRLEPEDTRDSGITIQQDGKVGIGVMGTGQPTHLLHVSGVARSTSINWVISSDRRIKENIEPLAGSLALLNELRPVSYEYSKEYQDGNEALAGKKIGFIAQEVEQVFPEMVSTISETVNGDTIDDFRLLNSSNIVPMLVDAVQELKAENEMLKALICLDHPEADICN